MSTEPDTTADTPSLESSPEAASPPGSAASPVAELARASLATWQRHEALAEAIVPLTGALYREQAVVCELFGTSLVRKTPTAILQIHAEAQRKAGAAVDLQAVHDLLVRMNHRSLGRVRVDLGKLLRRFELARAQAAGPTSLFAWADAQFATIDRSAAPMPAAPLDVVLYGFGRIGRLIARILIGKTGGGDKYRLRAIVLRPGQSEHLARRASLLQRDSVHGPFQGTVEVDVERDLLIINGNVVQVIYATSPDTIDYTAHGIHDAVVIDNTGKWRDAEGLRLHLRSPGVGRVVLTAPGKGVPNIVYGVNQGVLTGDESIISAASCTTNAIVPPLASLDATFGIVHGHVETVHAYTNDQNLIDNFHKKDRRGRGAPLNMVITSTGAAKAAALALPQLAGRLTGSAIRVPTPNVSLAILHLQLGTPTTADDLNAHFRDVALDSPLARQIDVTTSPEIVSSDLVGSSHAGVVDVHATIVSGTTATVYVWYDNEFGYSCQVVRLMQHLAGFTPVHFPA